MNRILFILSDITGWINIAIGVLNLLVVIFIAIINYLILEKFNKAQREFEERTRRLNLKPDIRLEYHSFNPTNNHVGFWVINNGKKAKDIEFNIVSGKIKDIHANKKILEEGNKFPLNVEIDDVSSFDKGIFKISYADADGYKYGFKVTINKEGNTSFTPDFEKPKPIGLKENSNNYS